MPGMEITTRIGCRNACAYCPQDALLSAYAKRSLEREMSFDTFSTCISKIPLNVEIRFAGMCEPWLNKECTRMVLLAHERGFRIAVFTTLVGMTPLDATLIQDIPFLSFVVHLPCREGDEHIDINEEYCQTLRALTDSRIKAKYIRHGKALHPLVKRVIQSNVSLLPLSSRAGNLRSGSSLPRTRRRGEIRCARQMRQNVLLPNGDVVLCCMDYGLKHILGNLLTSDFTELFSGDEYCRLERGLKSETEDILCRRCDLFACGVGVHSGIRNFLRPFWRGTTGQTPAVDRGDIM